MSVGIQAEQMADLVVTTTRSLKDLTWKDLTQEHTSYLVYPMLKRIKSSTGGRGPRVQMALTPSDAAQSVGLYQTITWNQIDTMKEAFRPWRHLMSYWTYEERAQAMNSGKEQLVNFVDGARSVAYTSLADKMESQVIAMPLNDGRASDGLFYWLVPWVTGTTALGFNGKNPVDANGASFSDCCGIDASVYARFRNYNGRFVNVSIDDLVAKLREATLETGFRSINDPLTGLPVDGKRLYADKVTWLALHALAEDRNINLGPELGIRNGFPTWSGNPILYLPRLNDLSSALGQIVLGVDWDQVKIEFLKKESFKEERPKEIENVPRAYRNAIWCSWQMVPKERRSHFILTTLSATGTTS